MIYAPVTTPAQLLAALPHLLDTLEEAEEFWKYLNEDGYPAGDLYLDDFSKEHATAYTSCREAFEDLYPGDVDEWKPTAAMTTSAASPTSPTSMRTGSLQNTPAAGFATNSSSPTNTHNMIETILCTPAGQFALIGLFSNALIGIVAYTLGRNNPRESALDRERNRYLHFLLEHPYLFEMALEALHKVQHPDQNKTEHPSTTP